MNVKSVAILVGATQLLSGCFLLGSGSKSDQQHYTPAVRNGSNTPYSEVVSANGYTAYMGNPDGTLSEVRVRMNADRTIAYVSKDGGPEIEYTPLGTIGTNGSSYVYGTFTNANGDTFYLDAHGSPNSPAWVESRENGVGNNARGYGGLQSAPEDLPDSANYVGHFSTYGDLHTSGDMTLNVDFANGDLGGSVSGTAYTGVYTAFTGAIDGSVSESRVSGAATIEGGATGELDLAGAAYGPNATYIAGGIAGTLTVGEDDLTTGGYFYTRLPPETPPSED